MKLIRASTVSLALAITLVLILDSCVGKTEGPARNSDSVRPQTEPYDLIQRVTLKAAETSGLVAASKMVEGTMASLPHFTLVVQSAAISGGFQDGGILSPIYGDLAKVNDAMLAKAIMQPWFIVLACDGHITVLATNLRSNVLNGHQPCTDDADQLLLLIKTEDGNYGKRALELVNRFGNLRYNQASEDSWDGTHLVRIAIRGAGLQRDWTMVNPDVPSIAEIDIAPTNDLEGSLRALYTFERTLALRISVPTGTDHLDDKKP